MKMSCLTFTVHLLYSCCNASSRQCTPYLTNVHRDDKQTAHHVNSSLTRERADMVAQYSLLRPKSLGTFWCFRRFPLVAHHVPYGALFFVLFPKLPLIYLTQFSFFLSFFPPPWTKPASSITARWDKILILAARFRESALEMNPLCRSRITWSPTPRKVRS